LQSALDGFSLRGERILADRVLPRRVPLKAHTICPYSKATRGNIEIKLLANGKPVKGG
jgi:hypothetical protein